MSDRLRKTFWAASFLGASCLPAFADTVLIGDARLVPRNGNGDLLQAGGGGSASGDGTAIVDDGVVLILRSGTDPDELRARPKIDVGEGFTGLVRIEGAGTRVELLGSTTGSKFEIGDDPGGDGTVEILDGATVIMRGETPGTGEENVFVQFGEDGGTGAFTMRDATLDARGSADVGILAASNSNSTGVLTLERSTVLLRSDGGDLADDDSFAIIGNGLGSAATALIEDTQLSLTASANTVFGIGREGSRGDVTLTGGSTVSMSSERAFARVGFNEGGVGNLLIDDGSTFEVIGASTVELSAGENDEFDAGPDRSTGRISVASGGTLRVVGGVGETSVQIGDEDAGPGDTSFGLLAIEGATSLVETNGFVQAGSDGGGATTGIIRVEDGTLRAESVFVGDGGFLLGTGLIEVSDLVQIAPGGTIAPGLSPGTLTIDGDLRLAGGALQIEIGGTGPGQSDVLSVMGDLIVDDFFDLEVSFIDGFAPEEGDRFDFLQVGGVADDLASFARLSFSDDRFGGTLSGTGGTFSLTASQVAPIPLPGAAWLLGAAVLGLGGLRRRAGRTSARP